MTSYLVIISRNLYLPSLPSQQQEFNWWIESEKMSQDESGVKLGTRLDTDCVVNIDFAFCCLFCRLYCWNHNNEEEEERQVLNQESWFTKKWKRKEERVEAAVLIYPLFQERREECSKKGYTSKSKWMREIHKKGEEDFPRQFFLQFCSSTPFRSGTFFPSSTCSEEKRRVWFASTNSSLTMRDIPLPHKYSHTYYRHTFFHTLLQTPGFNQEGNPFSSCRRTSSSVRKESQEKKKKKNQRSSK